MPEAVKILVLSRRGRLEILGTTAPVKLVVLLGISEEFSLLDMVDGKNGITLAGDRDFFELVCDSLAGDLQSGKIGSARFAELSKFINE